jgi:hypothetical protein
MRLKFLVEDKQQDSFAITPTHAAYSMVNAANSRQMDTWEDIRRPICQGIPSYLRNKSRSTVFETSRH